MPDMELRMRLARALWEQTELLQRLYKTTDCSREQLEIIDKVLDESTKMADALIAP